MHYTPPAVENRFQIEARLGVALPSGQEPIQPVWRKDEPERTTDRAAGRTTPGQRAS